MTLERAKNGLFWLSRSDLGILFLLVNVVAMGWWALMHSQAFPDGFAACVGMIFGGKTVHSVALTMKKHREEHG